MKGKITIFAIFLFIVFFAIEAQAVDWVSYAETEGGYFICYYDPQSIKQISKDVVQVWQKTSYSKKGVQNMIETFGPAYKEVSYAVELGEYNCSEKKLRYLSTTFYKQDGAAIIRSSDASSWGFVAPESMSEILFNVVCGSH